MSTADPTKKRSGAPKPPAGTAPAPAEATFEDALEQVEAIIDRIERGEVGLEESLVEYERGVELIKRCRGVLERAEQRVEELTKRMESDRATADEEEEGDEE